MKEYSKKAVIHMPGRNLVVRQHAIQLADTKGNREELARLHLCTDQYVIGDQRELDEAGIFTPNPTEQAIPEKPSFALGGSGEEIRGVQSRMEDKKVYLQSGGQPRESELDLEGIRCSLFVAGINGISERENFQLIDFLTNGAIQAGAIVCGGISRDKDGMMLGPTFLRCCSSAIRSHVWASLEGKDAWTNRGTNMASDG